MKKIMKTALALAGLAVGAHAQFVGLGYDTHWNEIQARLGLGRNALDIGLNLNVDPDNGNKDARFTMSASGLFLGHLHDWGPVDTYFAAGGRYEKTDANKDNQKITGIVGFQPEVTLLDHIAVSTRLGLEVPLMPSFLLKTTGNGISIVDGFSFKILF